MDTSNIQQISPQALSIAITKKSFVVGEMRSPHSLSLTRHTLTYSPRLSRPGSPMLLLILTRDSVSLEPITSVITLQVSMSLILMMSWHQALRYSL